MVLFAHVDSFLSHKARWGSETHEKTSYQFTVITSLILIKIIIPHQIFKHTAHFPIFTLETGGDAFIPSLLSAADFPFPQIFPIV